MVEKNRNYGIDLLRIIAMFFVIILHSYGQGGILANVSFMTSQYKFSYFVEMSAFCAVNIFALISGYVLYDKKAKISNYINMWLQIVFYGLIINIVFNIIDESYVPKSYYFDFFLPVTKNLYWYFTAYTGLFILIPLLNNAIKNTSDKILKIYFLIIIIIFSVFDSIIQIFNLGSGYTLIWLILLYMLGAIIKKCNICSKYKTKTLVIALIISHLLTYLYIIYMKEITVLKITIPKINILSYTTLPIVLNAILYIIIFSRIKFNDYINKIISFFASSIFSVYIINNHRCVWFHLIEDLFINISSSPALIILIYTFSFAILFIIYSILIDKIRIFIFKICHIFSLSNRIEKKIDKLISS